MDTKAADRFIVKRGNGDDRVMRYIDDLRKGRKTAVFYGSGHMRRDGGFPSQLNRTSYTLVAIITEKHLGNFMACPLAQFIEPDDTVVLIHQKKIGKCKDLLDLATIARSSLIDSAFAQNAAKKSVPFGLT